MTKTKFWFKLKHKLFKIPEGGKITGLAFFVKVLLFPIDALKCLWLREAGSFYEDFYTGTIIYGKYKITRELLERLATFIELTEGGTKK
ncbi:hypothetical protein KAR91_24585 [Candidatus Pacearchaeota archaeon]|nr:hypothetical protein [Candidatus Pacearchaeota archaeon]